MRVSTLLIVLALGTAAAAQQGEPPMPQGLTTAQQTELKNATTKEARHALLESWGIKPPDHDGGRGPKLTDAQKTQLDALKAQEDAATTDEEKQSIREQIKALFDSARPAGEGGHRPRRTRSQSSGSGAQ